MRRAVARGGLVVSLLVCTTLVTASAQTVERSLEEWLAVQGTFCHPDGSGGCARYQGPQPLIIGVEDLGDGQCAFVDYAGVIDRWLATESGSAVSLPTTVTGSVKEHILPDGTAEITVRLVTTDALVFVTESCVGGVPGAVIFARSPAEVLAGATPTLADVTLTVKYLVPAPGLPFEDLVELLTFPEPLELLNQLLLDADARGELRAAFGVPDGTPGLFSTRAKVNLEKSNTKPMIKQTVEVSVE